MKKLIALWLITAAMAQAMTEEEFIGRTQELYDAVATGDKRPWRKYYADDCLFFDEKGRDLDKAALVADIQPLPKGYSGTIKVVKVKSRIDHEVALLSYDTDETETVFGQELQPRYHVTDTWRQRNGEWQIVASQTLRYYEDPARGRPDTTSWPKFAGTYELAPDRRSVVTMENGKLFMERKEKRVELQPESSDVFFRTGVEGRILFRKNEAGEVDALIDRRNNEDIVWRKVAAP